MHLLDTTLFYAPQSGGIKRYLMAKHAWLCSHPRITHTLLVPGGYNSRWLPASKITLRSPPLPFGKGHRLPLNLHRWHCALRALKPDLIEAEDPYHLAWLALHGGRELDVPVVGFYHSDLPRLLATRFGVTAQHYGKAYIRQLYRRFDLVLAPSKVLVEKLQQEFGIERARQQPLGVDILNFHPRLKDPSLRRSLGLPADTRLLIFAGRFSAEKKLPVLLEAMKLLGRPYHLLLVGGGAILPQQANVTVLSYQQNVATLARLLASCDALAHPGDQETFGLVVLEAMACGLPVIGMAAGGVAELVDERVGLLAPPRNAKALAEAIAGFYQLNRFKMGLEARRKAESQYSWDRIIPQLLGHYNGLLDAGARLPATGASSFYVAR